MKVGLVFAGGGGKGAFQIGVWKALKEAGIDKEITGISGTSVGALNGIIFSLGGIKRAEEIWLNLDKKIIKFEPKKREIEFSISSKDELVNILKENINAEKINSGKIELYATCKIKRSLNKVEYIRYDKFDKEKIIKVLMATTAIPVIFESEVIDCKEYIDGSAYGIGDNVPVKPLYDAGFKKIIVIHTYKNQRVNLKKYPDCEIIEIIPSKNLGIGLKSIVDFSQKSVKKFMEQGYNDAKKIIEKKFIGILATRYDKKFLNLADRQKDY